MKAHTIAYESARTPRGPAMLFGADELRIVNCSISINAFTPSSRSYPHHRRAARRRRMQDVRKARRLGDVIYRCLTCSATVQATGGLVVRQGRLGSIGCGCGTTIDQWAACFLEET